MGVNRLKGLCFVRSLLVGSAMARTMSNDANILTILRQTTSNHDTVECLELIRLTFYNEVCDNSDERFKIN